MKLQTKWEMRQVAIGILSLVCSLTGLLFVSLAIAWGHFLEVGLDMYQGVKLPVDMTLQEVLSVFNERSVIPTLHWLPVTLVVDTLFRRYHHRLHT